jgi:CRISPR-associated protein Csm3
MSNAEATGTPERVVHLKGRIFLSYDIRTITGLHIGGSPGTLAIGNVDNPVIRDLLTGAPYIPGSSLRGKMRSQQEKAMGKRQNNRIGQVTIHTCKDAGEYRTCELCRTFGIPGEYKHSETSRLIVRDAFLTDDSTKQLRATRTDLPFTEVKWEAAIDRVTSAATPRQQERVPAGAVFSGELTFSIYDENEDTRLFSRVLEALTLVEEDYLGGQGARGSGQVKFQNLTLQLRMNGNYADAIPVIQQADDLAGLREQWRNKTGG